MTAPQEPDRVEHRMERSYRVAATPEQVWAAIATTDGLSAWMVPTQVDAQVGGEVSFDHGDFISTGVVTDVTPSCRFAYEQPWPISADAPIPSGMLEWFDAMDISLSDVRRDLPSVTPLATEFLIESESGGSCVIRVVTSGYGTGSDWENEFFAEMIAGWAALLDNLVAHLGGDDAGRDTMSDPIPVTITPILVADLLAGDVRLPVYVHVIDHPEGRVLVDTGLTELHPAVADMDPRIWPLDTQDLDLAGIDLVVNTHLHFDHCGGNGLFPGVPTYVQRRELDDARSQDDYTIPEWVDAPGVTYVPVDGAHALLPGIRLVPAPGHTAGLQIVVVETGEGRAVIGGDVAVWFGELDEPSTEGQRLVRALEPDHVWLAHEHEPWRPTLA